MHRKWQKFDSPEIDPNVKKLNGSSSKKLLTTLDELKKKIREIKQDDKNDQQDSTTD